MARHSQASANQTEPVTSRTGRRTSPAPPVLDIIGHRGRHQKGIGPRKEAKKRRQSVKTKERTTADPTGRIRVQVRCHCATTTGSSQNPRGSVQDQQGGGGTHTTQLDSGPGQNRSEPQPRLSLSLCTWFRFGSVVVPLRICRPAETVPRTPPRRTAPFPQR